MTETLPKPIDPQDIRVGMRVRVEYNKYDADFAVEFTVGGNDPTDAQIKTAGDGPIQRFGWTPGTWTLLADAPKPKPEPGSHWRDPETGAEYVRTDGVGGSLYYRVRFAQGMPRKLNPEYYNLIARLQPLPAFDPATLWPPAKLDDDWCAVPDENTGNVCSRPAGHDGWVHAAYEAYVGRQELGPLLAIWGDPR